MKSIIQLGAIALVAFATACGNTADGLKQDAAIAAEKTGDAAGAAGTKIEGALQTGEVKGALLADTRIESRDISVNTSEENKTVRLSGTVKTAAEKQLAGEVATSKSVGYKVINNLVIAP